MVARLSGLRLEAWLCRTSCVLVRLSHGVAELARGESLHALGKSHNTSSCHYASVALVFQLKIDAEKRAFVLAYKITHVVH